MKTNSAWTWALAPTIVALAIVGIIAVRYLTSSSPATPAPEVQLDNTIAETDDTESVLAQEYPLAEFPPRPSEAQMVSSSQLIVIARATRVIGEEIIPPVGEELVTPSPSGPIHGVRTTKYVLEVERFVKGKRLGADDTLILQNLTAYTRIPLNERLLLFLVPYRPGTYQSSVWTTIREQGGTLVYVAGGAVREAAGMTLDEYKVRLSSIAARQAAEGPMSPLGVPAVLPGETIIPSQLLGLQNTKAIQVTEVGRASRSLGATDIAKVIDITSQPMRIEAATAPLSARTVRIAITLDDGHVWEFAYAPSSGKLVYEPANVQVTLPESARAIVSSALGAAP